MGRSDINYSYIIDNLDRAISENWIQAYYMPLVRSTSGRVCEEEALARWIDPDKGMLSPAEFIPVLEEAKLIYKLDLHIVEEVLKKMNEQAKAGLFVVPISINISRTDFDSCDIVEEIKKRADTFGVSPNKLSIELTESALGSDLEYIKKQIERFQSYGFSIWMDDFGSGYSSLDILQDISFDHIKFDLKFMQNFDKEKSRIMLYELMRMAMALGIKTVAEGVETKEQVDFLREIGCNKMQGYYFCKPISKEQVFERYEKGIQIGFENPEESEFFDTIGGINLYDISVMSGDDGDNDSVKDLFVSLPIAVYECDDEGFSIIRCNKAYLKFEEVYFKPVNIGMEFLYSDYETGYGSVYASSVKRSCDTGERVLFSETLPDNSQMHVIVRRISVNPVTGVKAVVVVILDIVKSVSGISMDYGQVAQALSSDYLYLYYVNINTEHFIEFSRSTGDGSLSMERQGEDFFESSRKDALSFLFEEDRERFISAFNKENVLKTIDENNSFVFNYRLLIENEPVYVNMKIVRMGEEQIIVGVNNVDAQTKLQKEYDKIRDERLAMSRIMALVGEYICIYLVDPETNSYTEYSSNSDYEELNVIKSGEDFFKAAHEDSMRVIYKEDVDLFNSAFNKGNMLHEIETNGKFTMIYRLMIKDGPTYVALNAAMLKDENKIIVGVNLYT